VVFDGKEDRMRNLMGTPRANIPSSSTFPTYTGAQSYQECPRERSEEEVEEERREEGVEAWKEVR
jgi:hypothetical protein